MKYDLRFDNPEHQIIRITAEFTPTSAAPQTVRLSKWRPGRYELANYPKNVVDVHAETLSGRTLNWEKTTTNSWLVHSDSTEPIRFSYGYYAAELNAGSSFFNSEMVYFNGVNLFVYLDELMHEPCEVTLNLPDSYQVACGMRQDRNVLYAENFHELADSPLFAADHLDHGTYTVDGVLFHIWFMGECRPDHALLKRDFEKFTRVQMQLFGEFPVPEYHFLFVMRNDSFRHGVEHQTSTVCALGPGYRLMQPKYYDDFLALCSHELFHTWNVKALRPADMRPYRYHEENYSRLHWITEGITTYYGDLMLMRSGVWTLDQYLNFFSSGDLYRHFRHDGRRHVSLEESSFESWVSGYSSAVPNRQISFYSGGAIAALVLDVKIRRATGNKHSLDDVMAEMYRRFGKTRTGYTRDDYQSIAEELSELELGSYFDDFIAGKADILPELNAAADYLGMQLSKSEFGNPLARYWGIWLTEDSGKIIVQNLLPGSPAYHCGISVGDELVCVNHLKIEGNVMELVNYFGFSQRLTLQFFHLNTLKSAELVPDPDWRGHYYSLRALEFPGDDKVANRESWMRGLRQEIPA